MLLLISFPFSLFAQNKTITGTVRDAVDVVIGASVMVKGNTGVGTITDMDGKFTLSLPASAKELVVSFIGYDNQTVVIGNKTHFDITLKESSVMLEEVVAIGYAKVKRKELTGSSVSVGSKELAMAPVTTAAQALAGKAAGVNIVQQSGAPGAEVNITVRGGTSITQGTQPLYIVDGFQMENGLQNVDINDIESIDVMKDASATAIYGARGSNGVVLITTKSGKSGKTEVSYNGFVSFDRLGKKLDLLGVEDYVKYQYEFQLLRGNQSSFANLFGGNINDADFYTGAYSRIAQEYGNRAGIDWQDEVFGSTGVTQNHNVNITGGTEKTKYMLSYNYTGEDGIMDKHGYQKNSIRAKINHELWKGVRFDFSSSMQMTKVEGGGTFGKGGAQMIAMPTLYFEYADGDQRRDVSVCNYGIYTDGKYQMNTYIGAGVGKYRINWCKDRGTSDSRRDINFPLLRYSDVLLMYAEALNELNGYATPDAVDALEKVRLRAFKKDASKIKPIPTEYTAFKNEIILERKLELSNESLRKTDLTRWGILYDHLMAEKDKLYQLARREGKYADVDVYRAYKGGKAVYQDPTVALPYITLKESDFSKFGLTNDEIKTLKIQNDGVNGGFVEKEVYEDVNGNIYLTKDDMPEAQQENATAVTYTILNMFGCHTIKNKGGLSVEQVEGISDVNNFITNMFYGLEKNKVEILPFSTTAIIDVNPGLKDQQHPCY